MHYRTYPHPYPYQPTIEEWVDVRARSFEALPHVGASNQTAHSSYHTRNHMRRNHRSSGFFEDHAEGLSPHNCSIKLLVKKKNKTRCDTKRARSIKRCTVLHRACSVCVGDKQTVTYRKNMYYANANEVKRCNRTKCTQLHNPIFDGTESCTTPSLLRRQLQGS